MKVTLFMLLCLNNLFVNLILFSFIVLSLAVCSSRYSRVTTVLKCLFRFLLFFLRTARGLVLLAKLLKLIIIISIFFSLLFLYSFMLQVKIGYQIEKNNYSPVKVPCLNKQDHGLQILMLNICFITLCFYCTKYILRNNLLEIWGSRGYFRVSGSFSFVY